jgi:DNA-binding NtrC family response regulator
VRTGRSPSTSASSSPPRGTPSVDAREGRLRPDLLHRIDVIRIEVPPLRERGEDLPDLAAKLLAEGTGEPPEVDARAMERLRSHPWPGNVRELSNVLARLRLEGKGRIDAAAVRRVLGDPDTTTSSSSPSGAIFPGACLEREGLDDLKRRLERDYIVHHFRRLGGDTEALARFLGLGWRQLFRRCRRLGISFRKEKARLGKKG